MKINSVKSKLRHSLEDAIHGVLKKWNVANTSKKMKNVLAKSSKKLANQIKAEIKKANNMKKGPKKGKAIKTAKTMKARSKQ